jgi:DNA-binding transcriptional LysR family regulator
LNLKHAGYVMAVLEEGSVTAAAKKLFISQPSLSQTIKAAEKELGAPIFDRSGKQPKLTLAGEKYVECMREIMTAEANLQNEIAEMKHERRARLRIGISAQRSIALLPQILPEFMAKYPLVTLELKEMPSVHLEESLSQGGCDVAFITTVLKQNALHYELLENERIVLMASKQTELARHLEAGREIELSAARDEGFINLTPGHSVRNIQNHLAELCRMEPRVLLELSSLEAAKLITARLSSVMVCPCGYIQGDPRVESLVSCYPLRCHGFERHFYFCYPKKLRLTSYMRTLCELARSECRKHSRYHGA